MSLLFPCIKADHPADSGLEGECTGKSLLELPRLGLTNVSSLRTVLLWIICLLQCWEVLLPLGERLARVNTALGAASLQPQVLSVLFLLVPLSDKPFGVWLSQCLLCRTACASGRFRSCCLLQCLLLYWSESLTRAKTKPSFPPSSPVIFLQSMRDIPYHFYRIPCCWLIVINAFCLPREEFPIYLLLYDLACTCPPSQSSF